MSISKELFGIERKKPYTPAISGPGIDNTQFNKCLDEIDQFELSEEEIVKIITEADNDPIIHAWEKGYIPLKQKIARYIKQNAHKIFVRKTDANNK